MLDRLAPFLFGFSVVAAAFLFGVSVGYYEYFPFRQLQDAKTTFQEILRGAEENEDYLGEFLQFAETPVAEAATARNRDFADAADTGENFLMFGGLNQYLDLCPEHGCLAVEVTSGGDVVHAYPYLPEEIYAANVTDEYPYEYIDFDPVQDTRPIGIERFPDGDLLVTFQSSHHASVFPFGTGVARVAPDGKPRWFRLDYTHHWPSPIRGDEILVPGGGINDGSIAFTWPDGKAETIDCGSDRPYRDSIRVLDGDGRLVREIWVIDAVLKSPYATVLRETINDCDPLHLNFVDVVRDDLPAGIDGVEPGDYVVSFRNISAFGFIDAQSGELKRIVRGTFIQQHSVQHLSGAKFLMFDNQGGNVEGGPSRLLEVDLATGVERTIFPTAAHRDQGYGALSRQAGFLSISPDRTRVMVNSRYEGTAFEVRLRDGEVLREFVNLQDVSRIDGFAEDRLEKAAIFQFYGIIYVPR